MSIYKDKIVFTGGSGRFAKAFKKNCETSKKKIIEKINFIKKAR